MSEFIERRSRQRRTVRYGATAIFVYPIEPLTVVVRNLTADGARLTLPEERLLPSPFTITLDRDESSYTAQIVWKYGLDLGVRFTPTA